MPLTTPVVVTGAAIQRKRTTNIAVKYKTFIRGTIMMISTEAELQAAQEVFRKYHFKPGTSKNHPLQASLEILAAAVENYQFLVKDTSKAA